MLPSSGLELLLDLHECQSDALNNPSALERILSDAALAAGFEVVSRIAHQFDHQGVTLVLILSQSHIALHTWPEEHFAALDVYACGEKQTIERGLNIVRENLIAQFGAQSFTHRVIERARDEHAFILSHLGTNEKQV